MIPTTAHSLLVECRSRDLSETGERGREEGVGEEREGGRRDREREEGVGEEREGGRRDREREEGVGEEREGGRREWGRG